MVILASYKVEYGQLHEMAPALGVRLLGTALVVISGFYRFPRQRTEWVSSPIIAAGSKWTTKSVPSHRTPKAPPIPFSSFLFYHHDWTTLRRLSHRPLIYHFLQHHRRAAPSFA